ncbi:MAG: porin family protein, partial [Rikenellaceae bacterium]|nr:porin family protein [Rikenellaceae bacterium]
MKKTLYAGSVLFLLISVCRLDAAPGCPSPPEERTVTFSFIAGDDMFYLREASNGVNLDSLLRIVDVFREEIASGRIPVHVDSYSASLSTERANRYLSYVRANRVKSELILKKGLKEENFITANYPGEYRGNADMVVVTLRIPVEEKPAPQTLPKREETSADEGAPFAVAEPKREADDLPHQIIFPTQRIRYSGWYAGANIGMPFFWGDFTSTAADKTYVGFSAGIYGGYHFNSWLGASLSLDYSVNKTGHRS